MLVLGPTAEGDLERTPLAHVLVFAYERRLTGTLFLVEPGGVEHVLRIERGAAVKVRTGDGSLLLGELLLDAGLIDRKTLEAALALPGLLGDALLVAERVEPADLEAAVERQFLARMGRIFALPGATTFRWHDGHDALDGWGGGPVRIHPLALLWAGLRAHGDSSSRLAPTLERLGARPLVLHPEAALERLGLDDDEQLLVEWLQARPAPLDTLVDAGLADAERVRRLVYLLAITRDLDLGGAPPLGAAESFREGVTPRSGLALGRVQLRTAAHRAGAALPDLPGEGERQPLTPRPRTPTPTYAPPAEVECAPPPEPPPPAAPPSPLPAPPGSSAPPAA